MPTFLWVCVRARLAIARDGIVAMAAERITSREPHSGFRAATNHTESFDRFDSVFRARRGEAASRTEKRNYHRRDGDPIGANREHEHSPRNFRYTIGLALRVHRREFKRRDASSIADTSSARVAAKSISPAPVSAITTIEVCSGNMAFRPRRKHSLMRRLILLRTTAPPTLRETVTPSACRVSSSRPR